MSDTPLLVMDAQESFRDRPYWTDADVARFVDRVQVLLDACFARNILILQVVHVADEGAFSLSAGWVTTLEPIRIKPTAVFHKRFHSALVCSMIDRWLGERGIRRLLYLRDSN